MKKNITRILASFLTIVSMVAIVAGATAAVFNDTAAFEGNTISTATVNIDARSEPNGNLPKPLSVSGLVPGEWTDWARGIVYNEADSSDVKVFMYVDNVTGPACGAVNLKVTTGHAGTDEGERAIIVYEGALDDLTEANRVEITGTGKIFDPTIAPNTSAVIQQQAQIAEDAENDNQGSCTWDEIFVAETAAVEAEAQP